ncbi:hypothetical protein [Marinoscillum furvescens]|uniref:Outer membrane lipoprotein-sorting protein n=1 Tax=Marinoscillum furvescens DSM 4134 TaxID=1122208 RepID=A0A3D9L4G0_MARFU|nr:hypothetical protein [Marinoscillum furvescens]RED98974.1 hypothetical protein C7460_109166 [Marinoscillum furvescens DSM 4134]
MRFFLLLICCTIASLGYSQEAEEILQEHFEAHGQKQWEEIRTVEISGKLVDERYYGFPMILTYKRPGKIRIAGVYENKRFAQAYDGTVAWSIAPWKKQYQVETATASEELILRNSYTPGSPLYPYREHLQFEGLRDMEGVLYYAFTMAEEAYLKTYFIDTENYRLYYEQIQTRFGSQNLSMLKVIDKYKSYGGMLIPTAVRFEADQLEWELVFDEVLLGVGANDKLFARPESQ